MDASGRLVYLFLDFDGVLHPADATVDCAFIHAERLGRVLADFPSVRVVVSSSWRTCHALSEMKVLCGPLLGPRLIDVTPILDKAARLGRINPRERFHADGPATTGLTSPRPNLLHERFEEIALWLATHAPTGQEGSDAKGACEIAAAKEDWIALDDWPYFFPPHCSQLMLIPEVGFLHADANRLRERLTALCPAKATP